MSSSAVAKVANCSEENNLKTAATRRKHENQTVSLVRDKSALISLIFSGFRALSLGDSMNKWKLLFMAQMLLMTFTANADTDRVTKICRMVTAFEYKMSWAFGTLMQEYLNTSNVDIKKQKKEKLIEYIDGFRVQRFELIKLLEQDPEADGVILIIRGWASDYAIDLGIDQPGKDKHFYEMGIFKECKQRFFSIYQGAVNDEIQDRNTKRIVDELIKKRENNPPVQPTIIIQQPPPNINLNPNACIQDGGHVYCPRHPLR